jgi:hypothetical protein
MLNLFSKFAQSYDYNYDGAVESYMESAKEYGPLAEGLSASVIIIFLLVALVVTVVTLIGAWKVYEKAKKPGWTAIVPIYNVYILQQIVGRPGWWTLWYFVPFVNLVVAIINCNDLAKSFGKGVDYTILLLLFPFIGYPILGFGTAKYKGPSVVAPKQLR